MMTFGHSVHPIEVEQHIIKKKKTMNICLPFGYTL